MNLRLPSRRVSVRILVGVLVAAGLASGCASLDQREREMTFRAVKSEAGWTTGVPDGVQEMYLPVGIAADAPRIHAWWWADANPDAPAVLYLHGARWNMTGHVRRMEALYQAAPSPKKLLLVENGSHNNSMWVADGRYQQAIDELFKLRVAAHQARP